MINGRKEHVTHSTHISIVRKFNIIIDSLLHPFLLLNWRKLWGMIIYTANIRLLSYFWFY